MDESDLWRRSGGLALTGWPDGPGLPGPGRPATAIRRDLDRIERLHPGAALPGVELLGERARHTGMKRNAPWSCGGSFRAFPTIDGHVGLSLSRPSDLALVPALVARAVCEPWSAVESWCRGTLTAEAVDRIRLLSLPGGAIGETENPARPGVITTLGGNRRPTGRRPLVVDLTSLWAGPLCARLLYLTGAHVVKVESTTRPDGTRRGSPTFFEELHRGHDQIQLDFRSDVSALRRLIDEADLVLESSRARALRRLGISAEAAVLAGTSWLSITARGRASDTVGYGDDVAACAGHVIFDRGEILTVGDALADPLAGVRAAAVAAENLSTGRAALLDVSMFHVAREALS